MATEVWVWQDGTIHADSISAAAMGFDGSSYVLAGYTFGGWSGTNAGESDLAAMMLDTDGTEVWRYQNGTAGFDVFNAATVDRQDGSAVLAGQVSELGRRSDASTNIRDFAVLKIDAEGTVLWEFQDGTGGDEELSGMAMADDGSVVVVGFTKGDWVGSNAGQFDFAAFRLDVDGTEVWRYQDGTLVDDYLQAAAMVDRDAAVVMVGSTDGAFSGSPSEDGQDFVAIKLDSSDGTVMWQYQDGSSQLDALKAIAATEDGGVVLAGETYGNWGADNAGVADFAAVKLDSVGVEVWRYQDGTPDFDHLEAAAVQANGSILLAGYTLGGWSGANSGGDSPDWALVSLSADGKENWRWQGGTTETDILEGLAAGSDGTMLLVGRTMGSWGQASNGMDFAAVLLETTTVAAPGPSAVATPGPSAMATSRPSAGTTSRPSAVATPGPSAAATPGSSAASTRGPSAVATPGSSAAATTGPSAVATPAPSTTLGPSASRSPTSMRASTSLAPTMAASPTPTNTSSNTVGTEGPSALLTATSMPASATSTPATAASSAPSPEARSFGPTSAPFADIAALRTTPAPTSATSSPPMSGSPSQAPTPIPSSTTPSGGGSASSTTPVIAGVVSSVGGVILVALGVWLTRRRIAERKDGKPHCPPSASSGFEHDASGDVDESGGGGIWSHLTSRAAAAVVVPVRTSPGRTAKSRKAGAGPLASGDVEERSSGASSTASSSTADIWTVERAVFDQTLRGRSAASDAYVADDSAPGDDGMSGASSPETRRGSRDGVGLGQAAMEGAQELAHHCQIPGISEAATLLSVLVKLVSDSRDSGSDTRLRQCRSIVMVLERAAEVAGKGDETRKHAERVLIEDVHDAILNLVELIETYQCKNKLAKVLMSTLFKRRQDELDAVVGQAITRLQLGLQVQVGHDVSAVREGIHAYQEAKSKSRAQARRKRKLDQVEIPEDQVVVTDELLGRGGFGEVFLADLNGRNAAAKVLYINHDLGNHGDTDILDGRRGNRPDLDQEIRQRKAFLRELDAMVRLRSPHTVNVFGAITSLPNRLVLVMELLARGDLRTLLKNSEQPLLEEQCQRIVRDICAGMTFLHGKKTVHGDLKSANVLLDGAGRAKIGDFGTSRWSQHTSTGLATYSTKPGENTHMSLAWSAPEVLSATGSTYASDVYSFGIVTWEVLSRELPWADVTHPREVYIRVVLNELRPEIPAEAPAGLADIMRACWAGDPEARPTFSAVMKGLKSRD